MKRALFLLISLPTFAFGQVDSVKEALSYFPLTKGDYWEYKTDSYDCSVGGRPCAPDSSAYSVEVVGDTLLQNGRHYKRLSYRGIYPPNSALYYLERVDSLTGSVYRYDSTSPAGERQVYNLFAAPGDTFLTIVKVPDYRLGSFDALYLRDADTTLLGVGSRARFFREFPPVVDAMGEERFVLGSGFGLYSFYDAWYGGHSATTLVYAKLGGKEYGHKIDLHADSIAAELSYYPLGKGNHWEYESVASNSEPPFEKDTSFYALDVVGDSVLPNGYRYEMVRYKTVYPGHDSSFFYERVDTSTGRVFRYDTSWTNDERETDSLFAQPGDAFAASPNTPYPFPSNQGAGAVCLSMRNDTIFYKPTRIREFKGSCMFETSYALVKGLGLYSYSFEWDFGRTDATLVYAMINHVSYGTPVSTGVITRPEVPGRFSLYQNYPDPFNPSTAIGYQLSAVSRVSLNVYDVLGRLVRTLVNNEVENAGRYEVRFDGSGLASGVYFYRLSTSPVSGQGPGLIEVRKMILLK